MPDGFNQSVRSDDRIDVQALGPSTLLQRDARASALVEVQDRRALVVVNLAAIGQKVLKGNCGNGALLHPDSGVVA